MLNFVLTLHSFSSHTCRLPCPHVQVKVAGEDSVNIPEHEIVTRRRQFRMKKERAEAKREKKVAKKIADQEKKELKIAKKTARDEAKKAKEDAKEQAKAAKQSRKSKEKSAAEKAKDRKTKKKGEKESKHAQSTEEMGEVSCQAEDPPAAEIDENPEASTPEDVQVTLPAGGFHETIPEVPVQSRKMKRLRHLSAGWKANDVDSAAQASMEIPETPTSKPKKMAKITQKKKKYPKDVETEGHEDASTPKEAIKNEDVDTKEAKKEKRDKTKAGKAKKEKADDTCKEKSRSKKSSTSKEGKSKDEELKSKGAKASKKKEAAKTSAGRTRKPKVEVPVDEPVKALLLQTLKECESSHCTHLSFEQPPPTNGLSFSTYWTRNTVGLKVARRFLQDKKAKGKGFAQIAYFGHNSPCTYASWVAAGIYVSRWNCWPGWVGFSLPHAPSVYMVGSYTYSELHAK